MCHPCMLLSALHNSRSERTFQSSSSTTLDSTETTGTYARNKGGCCVLWFQREKSRTPRRPASLSSELVSRTRVPRWTDVPFAAQHLTREWSWSWSWSRPSHHPPASDLPTHDLGRPQLASRTSPSARRRPSFQDQQAGFCLPWQKSLEGAVHGSQLTSSPLVATYSLGSSHQLLKNPLS